MIESIHITTCKPDRFISNECTSNLQTKCIQVVGCGFLKLLIGLGRVNNRYRRVLNNRHHKAVTDRNSHDIPLLHIAIVTTLYVIFQ